MTTLEQASRGFSAAGSQARLEVLRALVRAGPVGLRITDIQDRLNIPASTLAHHLRILQMADLIKQHKIGREVISKADFDRIRDLAEFLLEECCAEAPDDVS